MPNYINIKSGSKQEISIEAFKKLPKLLQSKYSLVKEGKKTEPVTKDVNKDKKKSN